MRASSFATSLATAALMGLSAAHAAPMTFVEVFGVDNSPSASATGAPFNVEVSDFFSADEFGQARADIGTLGVSAGGSVMSRALFSDTITIAGGAGVFSMVFDLDGTFGDDISFLDMKLSTTVSTDDASLPVDSIAAAQGASVDVGDPPTAIATSFTRVDTSLVTYDPFVTDPSSTVDLSLESFSEAVVDGQMIVYLSYVVGEAFDFTYEMAASASGFGFVDFFSTAELVAINAVDPVTLNVMDDPTFSAMGQGGGDLVALAAANAGGDPIPVPGAIWLMGAGVALLGARKKVRQ
ncbi:MAG: hypothetical protein AAGI89_01145 [Pseudomonadota bacterium]